MPSSATMFRSISRRNAGFTLVEILVAIAILILLMLFTAVLMNATALTIANGNKHLDADSQARTVFDRMQMDVDGMLKRRDIDFQFLKQTGNDAFYFYSRAPGYFGGSVTTSEQSDVSLVGYSINTSNQLQRLGTGLSWANMAFLPTTFSVASGDPNFHVLAPSVFRLEIAFLLRQDDNTFIITDAPPAPGSQNYQSLWAILVDIGVLDTRSRETVQSYSQLIAALPDFTGSQTLSLTGSTSPLGAVMDPILNSWSAAIESPAFFQTAGIPKGASTQVHIYERCFYLK